MNPKQRIILAITIPLVAFLIMTRWLLATAAPSAQICNVPGDHSTIQAAVDDPTCDTINVGSGTFVENVTISRTVTIAGQSPLSTTVDGNDAGSVFTIQPNSTVTLTGMTITNGQEIYGGGIQVFTSSLTISNSILSDNHATSPSFAYGGGIYNINSIVALLNSSLINNLADYAGGGVFNGGVIISNNSLFDNNSSLHPASIGGGIYNYFNSTTILNNNIFSNNSASMGGSIASAPQNAHIKIFNSSFFSNSAQHSGGAVLIFGESNDTTIVISNSTFINNWAGAGSAIRGGTVMTIVNSSFIGNFGGQGTINNFQGGKTYIRSSVIGGNIGEDGAGIVNTGVMTINNSTISNNHAVVPGNNSQGGGIYNYEASAIVTIINSTIANNSADAGSGIFNSLGGTVKIQGSILANSSWDNCGGEPITSLGNNLVTSNDCNTSSGLGDIISSNPLLGALQDNGGPTLTQALLPGSPAIDHIPDGESFCQAGVSTDQRGFVRAGGTGQGGTACDIGAYEFGVADVISGLIGMNNSPTILGQVTTLSATTTLGSNINYNWGFGDSSVGTGSMTTHIFQEVGVYTAVVTASNSVSTITATTVVTVVEAVAGLTATNDGPTTLDETTTLTAMVTAGSNVAYSWDFGDGSLGSGAVVTHMYEAAGVYTAVVTASNSVSTITATTVVIVVETIAGLTATNDGPTALDETTTLTAMVTAGSDVAYSWDFGDGSLGSGAVVTHMYEATGVYTAVVTATNSISNETVTTIVVVEESTFTIYLPVAIKP